MNAHAFLRSFPRVVAAIALMSEGGMNIAGLESACANPMSEEARAAAAEDFHNLCMPCHGTRGTGDGPLAKSLKVPPADLTRISERVGGSFPADAVYDMIEGLSMPDAHGSRDMPVWGDRFVAQVVGQSVSIAAARAAAAKAGERIRVLVRYLETIQPVH